jgi:hypothetical protein
MKPYSIKKFLELLKQNRIRRNWNGIYFDIADYPFYDENRATPEVLNNLYNIVKEVK